MPEAATMRHVCDGCGETVDAAHVRDRIARLEMATRFRPLHIQTLLLMAAPPAALEDFFYSTAGPATSRLFRAVCGAAGVDAAAKTSEACLTELQRHGLYLACVNECPVDPEVTLDRLAATLVRRIRSSYRPKNVVALDAGSQSLLLSLEGDPLAGIRVVALPLAEAVGTAFQQTLKRTLDSLSA